VRNLFCCDRPEAVRLNVRDKPVTAHGEIARQNRFDVFDLWEAKLMLPMRDVWIARHTLPVNQRRSGTPPQIRVNIKKLRRKFRLG
jgi:hypothetical protein